MDLYDISIYLKYLVIIAIIIYIGWLIYKKINKKNESFEENISIEEETQKKECKVAPIDTTAYSQTSTEVDSEIEQVPIANNNNELYSINYSDEENNINYNELHRPNDFYIPTTNK